jgi:hypothetical protein
MTDTFQCGSRAGNPQIPGLPTEDNWEARPDGSRCCSYCGSLHPEDFLDILRRYAAGEGGYRFDTTDKGYKAYANRPGVQNALEGGIKFYGWHAVPEGHPDRAAHEEAWAAAVERHRQSMAERYGAQPET